MDYYFITGTSRGLGKALAEYFLLKGNAHVTGIARSSSIEHANYKHWSLDLANIVETERFLQIAFKTLEKASRIVLINNAGTLGKIDYIGKQNTSDLTQVFNLNIISPVLLTNHFIKKYESENCPKIIINISSGAGHKPYDGWASYCASKSALNLFSETVALEQQLQKKNTHIFAVAPGVVNTEMQTQIRASNPANFSQLERFQTLKKDNLLDNPTEVAQKIAQIIEHPNQFENTVLDVRKF